MQNYSNIIDLVAKGLLIQSGQKPNYSNRNFMNATIIFETALIDKMFDYQNEDNMSEEDRINMAISCGKAFRKFIHTYTGLNTNKIEDFL